MRREQGKSEWPHLRPKVCRSCKSAVDSYLVHSSDQERSLRVIADLTLGIEQDEGLDSEGLARIGQLLLEYFARRGASEWFFFGDGSVNNRPHDKAVVMSEIALLNARYPELTDHHADWIDTDGAEEGNESED